MAEDFSSQRVECTRHGSTARTFACQHLAAPGSSGLGVCYDRASTEPWPDIVCNACSAEPEWTEAQALERIKVLCTFCWEDAFASNTEARHRDPDDWLHGSVHRTKPRHDRWVEEYGITTFGRYRYELEEKPPWLGFGPSDNRFTVMCEPAVIGSWSPRSGTWLWGWANDWWQPELTAPFIAVKRLGEKLGIERLWRCQFVGDEALAWEICAAALDVAKEFEGIYRSPGDEGALFLAARNTRRVA